MSTTDHDPRPHIHSTVRQRARVAAVAAAAAGLLVVPVGCDNYDTRETSTYRVACVVCCWLEFWLWLAGFIENSYFIQRARAACDFGVPHHRVCSGCVYDKLRTLSLARSVRDRVQARTNARGSLADRDVVMLAYGVPYQSAHIINIWYML